MIFFLDRCPVEEHLFRRFLKYLENGPIFDFFPFFFTKHVILPFFNLRAGNACRAITLFFLFQSPSILKNKCGILMRFKKKKSLNASHALCCNFSNFCRWRCRSRHFVLRSFARMQKKEFFKNSHQLSRYQLFHYRLFVVVVVVVFARATPGGC